MRDPGNSTNHKILVIEENSAVRTLFLDGLRVEGFDVMGAENGYIGLQYAQEYSPDLITCGIVLPVLDGFTVLQTLRQNPYTAMIPLIFVTIKMARSDLHKAMALGANGYLTKPCTIKDLKTTILAQLANQTFDQNADSQLHHSPDISVNNEKFSAHFDASIYSYSSPLSEAFSFIQANFHRPISLCDVAQAVDYSPAYLTHLMGQQTGKTVQQWIIQHRMIAASYLLLNTNHSIEQIAEKVGYLNAVHFFRHFRRQFGTTPQTWRKKKLSLFV